MAYVHGYSERETQRLLEQSLILEDLLHSGTEYPAGSRILEVGCGVGAQTRILVRRNPGIQLTSIDISADSLRMAETELARMGHRNVSFLQMDICDHRFAPSSFDHIFVCFLLEHLPEPAEALRIMKGLLKEGGSITVIEGDHGSGFWTPETVASKEAWNGLILSQQKLGHDPNIGRRLYPILKDAGFSVKDVSPRPVYADRSDPVLLNGVVNQIIVPMVFSAQTQVMEEGLLDRATWQKGLDNISRVAVAEEGTFFYTWFKGTGIRG
jgi:SAM-dependent methyltransferase